MSDAPTYDELKQRVEELEAALYARNGSRVSRIAAGDLELHEILDIPLFQSLLESLYGATGIPSALLDAGEKVLIAVGWQEICTQFHRRHPECAARCRESDTYIKSHLSETGFVGYRCANGLWDFAFPIRFDGRHMATFFFGQVFLEDEPIDRSFFREQARTFGFDEAAYMAAVDRTPVISRDRLNHTLAFSEKLARLAVAMGTKTLSEVRSISQRNRAWADMRESRARFQLAVQGSNAGLWDIDIPAGAADLADLPDRMHISSELKRFIGYESWEFPNSRKAWLERIHLDDRAIIDKAARNHFEGRTPVYDVEYRIRHRNGPWRWIGSCGKILKDDRGVPFRWTGLDWDITARKESEAALRESEAKFRGLFEQAGDAIFIHDKEGRFVDVNQKACEHTGYDRAELLALNVTDIDPDAGERGDGSGPFRRSNGPGRTTFEARHMKKDGATRPVEVSLSPIEYGGTEYILAIARDITERKRLEDQLRQAQKMEAIGTLAGGIAHDFNNILAPIIGYSEMTADELPEDSPLRRNIVKVLDSAQRARNLVQQILTFSRKFDKTLKPFRIRPIVKEALKLLRATIPAFIEIQQDIAETGAIRADPTQIHQIVINLCTNAYHAMWQAGGVLRVALMEVDVQGGPGAIHPEAQTGRYVRLTVADAGGGIDPAIVDNIFEPYFTTKEEGKGTGLGLAVVDGIVRDHGGFITLDNHPGRGCAFHVFFPVIPEESRPVDPRIARDCPVGSERILLVEDEPPLLEMIQRMLESLGYEVTPTGDGDPALALFQSTPDRFDLVLTDMTMPHMTGDRLALEVKSIRPDVPVILYTGYSDKIDKKGARELGLSGFLLKPIFRGDLAVAVRNALDSEPTENDP